MYRLISKIKPRQLFISSQLGSFRSVSYTLPTIPLLDNLKISKDEFKGLYSNNVVNELWFKRGEQLVEGLNQLLEENNINPPSDLNELITLTFNKPDLYGIYSYASLIHNLQFSLESLKPNESEAGKYSIKKSEPNDLLKTPSISQTFNNEPTDPNLREWIINSFGSIAEFRTLLLNSAKGIKGDGLVWLVAQATYSESTMRNNQFSSNANDFKYSTLSIMNTYNAGIVDDSIRSGQITKLKQQKQAKIASLRKKIQERKHITKDQEVNEESENGNEEDALAALESEASLLSDLTLGTVEEAEAATLYSDRKLLPLLAIDASLRNYLLDYGVFGKQQYLDNVWDCIDWDVVSKRAPIRFKQSFEMD